VGTPRNGCQALLLRRHSGQLGAQRRQPLAGGGVIGLRIGRPAGPAVDIEGARFQRRRGDQRHDMVTAFLDAGRGLYSLTVEMFSMGSFDVRRKQTSPRELSLPIGSSMFRNNAGEHMQAAVDRVMQTYGMMVNLTPGREAEAGQKVSSFLKEKAGDEHTSGATNGSR
jgi:hypothetical protein